MRIWFAGTVALCGGTSRRMGVPDKTALEFGDATILDSALTGLPHGPVVCVGSARPLTARREAAEAQRVLWTREQPPSGGPVAGIRAGLDALIELLAPPQAHESAAGVRDGTRSEPIVAVIAGDQPFAGRTVPGLVGELVRRLHGGGPIPDGVAVASPGRGGPLLLLAVFRLRMLDPAIGPDVTDQGVYQVLGRLKVDVVDCRLPQAVTGFTAADLALDVDDPDDLARAIALLEHLP